MSRVERVENKVEMCPRNRENDFSPNRQDDVIENIESYVIIEDGLDEILSGEDVSDDDTVEETHQGYVSLAQSEDDIALNNEVNEVKRQIMHSCEHLMTA